MKKISCKVYGYHQGIFSSFENSMDIKKIYGVAKRNKLNILFAAFFILIVFSPGAKAWILKQLISIGIFNADIKNVADKKDLPDCAPFSFINSKGEIANTTALKGKIVFINFWASWCPPCRAEMSSVNELYRKFKDDKRFVFLLISEDDDRAKAKDYLDSNHFILPVYFLEGSVSDKIYNGTLPTTIVVNKEGKIVLKHDGIGGYNTDSFVKQLKELL
jgi:thiol-disulfide isomerase/thioredoxin